MNDRKDILQELKSMDSFLADLSCKMPYSVPSGYFDEFPAAVQAVAQDISLPEDVPAWGKKMPYSVPAGYFEVLPDRITSAARYADTGKEKTIPFAAPAGYFEQLPGHMLSVAKAADQNATTAKIIPLKRHDIFRSIQWAAAAIFIVFIGIGSYISFFSERTVTPEVILASVPNNEINDYVERIYRIDVDQVEGSNEVSDIPFDNNEIIEYLNETGWDVVD